ncbi:hypothetical protein [Yoonia algicola]|uniref:Uncharacterized protein n=1 Tax=Yoonia algicola TaxID=3137368 RepID=A0AAN0NJB4_9RHOB
MPKHATARYCADPQALAAMKRDGLGWGHDLDCGCFHDAARHTKTGGLARVIASLTRRTPDGTA